MPELDLNEIRYALQKECVLGDDRFKRKIEEKIGICRDNHEVDRKNLVFLMKKSKRALKMHFLYISKTELKKSPL